MKYNYWLFKTLNVFLNEAKYNTKIKKVNIKTKHKTLFKTLKMFSV